MDESMINCLRLESKVVNYLWHLSSISGLKNHGDISLDD